MQRRETPSRGRGIEEGLAVRLHDPLWLFARQWQFGEFRHENAASPAWIEVETEIHTLDEWKPAADERNWQRFDAAAAPLERLVEEHGGGPTPRLRLEGGLRLRRQLVAAGATEDLATFATRCPFPTTPLRDGGDELLRSRLPDGRLLVRTLGRLAKTDTRAAEIDELKQHGEVHASAAELGRIATEWINWWNSQAHRAIPDDEDCWDEHRFEHAFALRARSLPELELRATEYPGGLLDWSAVDACATEGGRASGDPLKPVQRGVPAPARFGGMPATRLWEMEDARFDPGSVDASPIDLGRLMLVAFATIYGNDWFVVPIRMPIASLGRVTRFDVRDVFGRTTTLTAVAADQDGWNLFGLTAADQPLQPGQERPTSPWFFLAASLPASLESAPTDLVLLLRDEMANVAWAVEALVGDDQGRPRDRFAEWASREPRPPVNSEFPLYRVATEVPQHWFPLVPERFDNHESIRLRLVPLTRLDNGRTDHLKPAGTLLPADDAWLYEEEVPRAGVQVTRTWQHARWHDGSRHLWQARHKTTGRGEGSSGLRYDGVEGA